MWLKWLRRTQELLSAISMPLGITVELLEGSHFFALSALSREAMGIRDDKQASGVLECRCFMMSPPVCTVFWQRSNLGVAASIPRVFFVFFAAPAVNSRQVWWLFSYGLACHLDSWTFWACGLWRKCQCWKIHQHQTTSPRVVVCIYSGKLRRRCTLFIQDGAPHHTTKKQRIAWQKKG